MRSPNDQLRELIAREAARIIVAGGTRDFHGAKRKAAERLGARSRGGLPSNREIEQAIQAHYRIFEANTQPRHLDHMRRAAREAIELLSRFEPCLVGPVLSGTADENCDVQLHLFSEPSEEVGSFLQGRGVRYRLGQRKLRFPPDETRVHPTYRCILLDVPIELVVFAFRDRGHPPLCPVDGRPMRRASRAHVERLVTLSPDEDPGNEPPVAPP